MDRTKKAWITAILFALTLVTNTLGGLGLINGTSQKDVSDRYQTLITPSSFTFSIWSVIYGLLIMSVIVLIVKRDDPYYGRFIDSAVHLFWASCVLNIAWIITFSYVMVEVAVLLILALTVTLALICTKLRAIHDKKSRWLLPLTFGLYAGWLFIASVVNIAAMLVKLEWNGFGLTEETWAIIMLSVSVVLVIFVMYTLKNTAFALPVAWAYFGIYMNLRRTGGEGVYTLPEIICIVGIVILLVAALIQKLQVYRVKAREAH